MIRRFPLLAALVAAGACTINPVTGERELALVSPAEEIAIGEAQYFASRQMQGGDYVLDPELRSYVAGVGARLAAVSDRPLPYEFVVLNSSVPNAWALPGGKIAVNRGLLLELQSEAELAAVLGHEIVHAAARHGAQAMQRGLILQGALLATAVAAQRGNYSGLVVGAATIGAQLMNQRYGREAELEADRYGMQYMSRAGYDPAAAVSLQETFMRLAEGRPDGGWLAGLFASHPPSPERVQQNRATASALPMTGELGRERYQSAIRRLAQRKPAYDAYDEARAALAEERIDDAERLAAEAVRLEPGEGHFHSLLGDIDVQRQQLEAAVAHYGEALARNDQFFYYPLRRGQVRQSLGQLDAAESDLQMSVALLPTADAYYGLGRIAEQRGDRATALERYAQAAGSSTPSGQAAQDAMVRLELPENPGKYLTLRTGLDAQRRLVVELGNPTRLPVGDVALLIRYVDAQGALRQIGETLDERLAPGASQRYLTGLGPFSTPDAYEVIIQSARVITQ